MDSSCQNGVPLAAIEATLRVVIDRSGLSPGSRKKLLDSISRMVFCQGPVRQVTTEDGRQVINVLGDRVSMMFRPKLQSGDFSFSFPPNAPELASELIRAQTAGLEVFVAFQEEGEPGWITARTLYSVSVLAVSLTRAERY